MEILKYLWRNLQNDERGILCLGGGLEVDPVTGLLSTEQACCRILRSTNQSITPGFNISILFDTPIFDTDNVFNPANPGRITIQTPGVYLINFQAEFSAASDYTAIYGILRVNGVSDYSADVLPIWNNASLQPVINLSMQRKFITNDYVEFLVFQTNTSSASRNALASSRSLVISAAMVSRG